MPSAALRRLEPTIRRVTTSAEPAGMPADGSVRAAPAVSLLMASLEVSPRAFGAALAGTTLIVVAVAAWSGDVRVPLLVLLGAATMVVLRIVEGRTRLSFGQGFLGYRGDGWPVGVQEDDDVHWSWHRSGVTEAEATPEPEIEILDDR